MNKVSCLIKVAQYCSEIIKIKNSGRGYQHYKLRPLHPLFTGMQTKCWSLIRWENEFLES